MNCVCLSKSACECEQEILANKPALIKQRAHLGSNHSMNRSRTGRGQMMSTWFQQWAELLAMPVPHHRKATLRQTHVIRCAYEGCRICIDAKVPSDARQTCVRTDCLLVSAGAAHPVWMRLLQKVGYRLDGQYTGCHAPWLLHSGPADKSTCIHLLNEGQALGLKW